MVRCRMKLSTTFSYRNFLPLTKIYDIFNYYRIKVIIDKNSQRSFDLVLTIESSSH